MRSQHCNTTKREEHKEPDQGGSVNQENTANPFLIHPSTINFIKVSQRAKQTKTTISHMHRRESRHQQRYIQDRLEGREGGHHYSSPHMGCSDWMTELKHSFRKRKIAKWLSDLRSERSEREEMGLNLKMSLLLLLTTSLLSSLSNQTAERYLICQSSDAFGQDIREWGWEKNKKKNQAKASEIKLRVGRVLAQSKTTAADSKPPERGEDTAGGDSQNLSAAVCSEMGQG